MSERECAEILSSLREAMQAVLTAAEGCLTRGERIAAANVARRLVELAKVKITDVICDIEARPEGG